MVRLHTHTDTQCTVELAKPLFMRSEESPSGTKRFEVQVVAACVVAVDAVKSGHPVCNCDVDQQQLTV